jgi:hypothetical protein
MSEQPPTDTQWPDEVKWVYCICNPQKEKERFERFLPHFVIHGIPKERLRVSGPTWADTLDAATIFKVYDPFLKRGDLPTFCYKAARLSKGELSLILNFFSAIQHAAKDISGDDMILIFESDAHIRRDFVKRLGEVVAAAKAADPAWCAVSLGEGVGTRLPGSAKSYYAPTQVAPAPSTWGFRCTDSMLLRGSFVQKLAQTLLPFKESLDWELNFQAMLHGAKVLWAEPPLAEQGTTHGRDETFLR